MVKVTPVIHPTAIIEDGAVIGDNVEIGPFCFIGRETRIGDGCVLHQSVVIDGATILGKNNKVFPFTVLGKEPQHTKYQGETSTLTIGDDNIIREHVTMHRGTKLDRMTTTIGSSCFIMVGCHIGHDSSVANHVLIANNVHIGGHVQIGANTYIGASAAIQQRVRIGRNVMVGGKSAVVNDVTPFARIKGSPCYLQGLNVVGLKQQGFDKARIQTLRQAYNDLFKSGGTFKERLASIREKYINSMDIAEILNFIDGYHARVITQPLFDHKTHES